MKIKKTVATDLCGKEISENLSLEYTELEGVTACFVSGTAEGGFKGDEAFVLVPDIQPKGEYLAIENHNPFWTRPFFGSDTKGIPERTQELLIKTENGYFCALPVCADFFKTLIRQGEEGFEFWSYTGVDGLRECKRQLTFVWGEDSDPHALLERVARTAARLLDSGLKMRGERRLPEVFKSLGWCSWDAFQFRVSHEGLLTKAREFEEKRVPVGFAILDDMWAEAPSLEGLPDDIEFMPLVRVMHYSKLKQLDGSPRRFPKGMRAAISDLKKYIPSVGIWFPTTGYWNGFDENGEDFSALGKDLVHIPEKNGNGFRFNVGRSLNIDDSPNGKWVISPEPERAERAFDCLLDRIKSWDADFVKIDNQGCHTHYKGIAPIGQSARALQNAIDKGSFKHFDGALINCMGMPSECMFNRPDSAVSRCSDDFQPESRTWFSKNILQCAYNGVLQGQYYINDWDMWWTDDEQAVKNSLCRSISGGPVYISDKVGRTRPEVLAPVCFDDGKISVCDYSAKPTADCLVSDPTKSEKPLKIFNRLGDTAVVAAYNITADNRAVAGEISAEDACLCGDMAYFEYFSRECGVIRAGEKLAFELGDNDSFKLYTLVPLKNGRAVFGRIDKYVSRGAVISENCGEVELYEGGEVGIYSETPITVFAEGGEVKPGDNGCLKVVELSRTVKYFTIK